MTCDKCLLCTTVSGPIVAGFFLLLGLLTGAIAAGVYNSSKLDGLTYNKPSVVIVAMHWVSMIMGIVLGIGLFLFSKSFLAGLLTTTIGGSLLLTMWILYMVFFFISDEFKMSVDAISLDELKAMWAVGESKCPYIGFSGTGYYLRSYHSNGRRRTTRQECWTNEVEIPTSDYCEDDTTFQEVTESQITEARGFRVYTDVSAELLPESEDSVDDARMGVYSCYVSRRDHEDLHNPQIVVAPGVNGVSKEVFVTLDGKAPWFINRGKAIAAGIFFSGVVYAYQVCMIPVLRQTIVKKNVSLVNGYKLNSEDICARMGKCDY